ncbi:uncharacterized protein bcl2l12 [Xyrichtys novacula]|uniref:Uncharacterized protein bcl2l12 n=1 Tax=Xyrichtys novacula TaxID=13765 RepID=A0AAV1GSK8_XYRNO|nr:uncharacterized protein bcl2l12 [Xyrichtys novacula]
MASTEERLPSVSSVSSISLLEIKADTHLVLKAFLHRTLTLPLEERPGRVGGAYTDHNKYSCIPRKSKDGWDSQAEDVSSTDEKKSGLKSFMKQLPRRSSWRSGKESKNSLERDNKIKPGLSKDQTDGDVASPSTSSDEDDGGEKEKEKDRDGVKPQRPTSLPIKDKEPDVQPAVVSPTHPPGFYDEVAERLEQIAQKSTSIKKKPSPISQTSQTPTDKQAVVNQLVQLLSQEGDSMNNKIQSDPFLRSNLNRLSYPSFAKLLDTFSRNQVSDAPTVPPTSSPTLRRMAVTMEVSRRIVTATGTQRMQGYAECYMETFAPWVKSHGGWENIVDLGEQSETE